MSVTQRAVCQLPEEAPHQNGDEELIDIATGSDPSPLPQEEVILEGLYSTLLTFVVVRTLLSFDSGAFSASLSLEGGIAEDLALSAVEQGWLSSSLFLGNMCGCVITGQLMMLDVSAKKLLLVSVVCHGLFSSLFAASSSFVLSLLFRYLTGLTLAVSVVYIPIWVEAFAPKNGAILWLAWCHVGVPLGIFLGYVAGGLLPLYTSLAWQYTFYFKSVLMIPLAWLVSNTQCHLTRSDKKGISPAGDTGTPIPNFIDQASILAFGLKSGFFDFAMSSLRLAKVPEYIFYVLSLTSLYFVLSGLQNFVTPYLHGDPFYASLNMIFIGVGLSIATAPAMGGVIGGVLVDRISGYHENLLKASVFSLICGVCAAVMAVLCILAETTAAFLLILWFMLFFGCAMVPIVVGLTMAAVPKDLRPCASSVSNVINNFGLFLGPLVCGYVIHWTDLQWGVRSILAIAWVGVAFLFCAFITSKLKDKNDDSTIHFKGKNNPVLTNASVATHFDFS